MRLLLDSHVLLWWAEGGERLPASLLHDLAAATNRVYVSIATLWELAIKLRTGRLRTDLVQLRSEMARYGMTELPIKAEHALAAADLPLHHRDPFDRMLIAQAREESLVLVSADRQFESYDVRLVSLGR